MAVDPNELMIFKMRSSTAQVKPTQPVVAPKPVEAPAAPVAPPQPTTPTEMSEEKPQAAPESVMSEELMLESLSSSEKKRAEEVNRLELRLKDELAGLKQASATGTMPTKSVTKEVVKSAPNGFARLSGLLFTINALVFVYFIMPQLGFLAGLIHKIGFISFVTTFTYGYGIAFVNLILACLSLLSGQLMFSETRRNQLLGTATGSMMLLTVSFEYLNSTAGASLLIVCLIAFASVVSLAVSRMSAISVVRSEQTTPMIQWPRIEAF